MKFKNFILLFLFFCFSGCGDNAIQPIELKRVLSPTGKLEAVFVECPTNATSDFLYGIVIVEQGKDIKAIKQNDFSIAGSSLDKESMHWNDNLTFTIKYNRPGKIYSYRNIWYSKNTLEGQGVESIELVLYPKDNNESQNKN